MRWRGLLAVLAVATGCDRVFSLESHVPVTGMLRVRYTPNNERFEPVVEEAALEPGAIQVTAKLDDGTITPVDYASDGSFSFLRARADQRYWLTVTGQGIGVELQHSAPQLNLARLVAGRIDGRPLTRSTIRFPFAGAPYAAYVATTGTSTFTNTMVTTPDVTFDWRDATITAHGRHQLLDGSRHDRAYMFELEAVSVPPSPPASPPMPSYTYARIGAVSEKSFTQETGSVSLMDAATRVSPSACARIALGNETEYARLVAAAPREAVQRQTEWFIQSSPDAPQMGLAGLIWIAIAQTDTGDLEVAPRFHNPFPGTDVLASAGVYARFEILLPESSTGVSVANLVRRIHQAPLAEPVDCETTPVQLHGTVGIPGNPVLGGTSLDENGKRVELDLTRDPELRWDLAAPGPVHTTNAVLYELVDLDGRTNLQLKQAILVVGQVARFDRRFFLPGHRYIVAVVNQRNLPGAIDGDFSTYELPNEVTQTWSRWFEIAGE